MEKEDTISVQWAQEGVETSYSLLNNNNKELVVVRLKVTGYPAFGTRSESAMCLIQTALGETEI